MSNINPFEIRIHDQQLDDLRKRLALTRWPAQETVEDWSQGMPLEYTRSLAQYLQNEYDWRSREERLNQFPHFMASVNGVDIHFIHMPSAHAKARPLLITHGWPGSIVEFLKVLKPLADPVSYGGEAADAFHVVAPSLPGFGFSGNPTGTGWGVEKIADTWAQLMRLLGYSNYFAQGGDWGAMVTTELAIRDPRNCAGIHLNMPIVDIRRVEMTDLSELEQSALAGVAHYRDWDSGYSKQQSTRPQTLGYGLTDSPVGQMAWIIEKFWAWSDCDGHPEKVFNRDELLDNVMLYWFPNKAVSSARLYWESFGKTSLADVETPTGCSIFPKEIFRLSKRWAKTRFKNLVYWNLLDKGGHFAAFERPEIYLSEIRNCFRQMR